MSRWCWLLLVLVVSGTLPSVPDTFAADVHFDRDIAPLLAKRCLSCHAGDAPKGKLDLTRRETVFRGGESGPAIVPRSLDESPFWQRIAADEMPPKHPLSKNEKWLLSEWITSGAEWGEGVIDALRYSSDERAGYDWWSLQPLMRSRISNVGAASRAAPQRASGAARLAAPTSIDSFIHQRLAAAQLASNPPAERRVLIRRLWFDLLGLPPSPEDVEQFVHDDRPAAYERLVERCLASPHYGERWARHWLDVVRFGESNGFERDLPRPNAWHYRDWVVAALNADLPYDEFVRWQLAGDAIAAGWLGTASSPPPGSGDNILAAVQTLSPATLLDDVDSAAALGFLVAGPHDTVVPVVDRMRQQMRQDELEDVVGVVGQTFLGLTVNCARCHDHKFDPISTKEYYQLAAALSGVDHGERNIVPAAVQTQLDELSTQLVALEKRLQREAQAIREVLLRERNAPFSPGPNGAGAVLPTPLAAWDFTRDLKDRHGSLHGELQGNAKLTPNGVELDGTSFVSTPPLPQDVTEKTLEVRVKLADLDQRGGGAISLQTLDGSVFDAVVFGEQVPRHWLAGSNNFQRTASFQSVEETTAAAEFVTITAVYRADGVIAGYRNGQPYGRSYQSSGPVKFAAGKTQVVFGLRHSPASGNRLLKGVIAAARVYPRALTDAEVAASASASATAITEADILARLEPAQRVERERRSDELNQLRKRHAELSKTGPIKMYTASMTQPGTGRVLKRGNVSDPGDVVTPAGLAAIATLPASFGLKPEALEDQRRAKLAEWITDRRNPLFARVMANRLWHYHFGSGLVETPNDLGFNGGRPSHPELLDWLACELIDSGYSLKHMHRVLVTSATYRQASTFRPDAAAIDAQNRLLWRMSPRRLDAECVRDAMLAAAGELNDALGGKGYSDFNSHFFKGTQFYDPIDPIGPDSSRRTIYRMWARGGRNPFLDTFDCPDPSTTTPKRSATTTPLQALSLMNNAFVLRMAERLAERVRSDAGTDTEADVVRAYELLFGRRPAPEETAFAKQFVERRGLAAACRGLMNGSEFLYVD